MNKKSRTLQYYDTNSKEYINDTFNVDFKELQDGFLKYLNPGDRILDLGCGSGRDALYFINKGYKVTAMDGSTVICNEAAKLIGQDVICSTFEDFTTSERYEGIWACSSLLHLDNGILKQSLKKFISYLKPNGVFYLSFKYGVESGYEGERFFNNMTEEKFRILTSELRNIAIIEERITDDVRENRADEKWYNVVIQKIGTDNIIF